MNLNINVIETYTDITECMMVEEIKHAIIADGYLHALRVYVMNCWPSHNQRCSKEETQLYFPLHDDMVVIVGILMKVEESQYQFNYNKKPLSSYTSTTWTWQKMRALAKESIYWVNINTVLRMPLKIAQHVWHFRWHNQKTN